MYFALAKRQLHFSLLIALLSDSGVTNNLLPIALYQVFTIIITLE
jgi:hypothetical protein